jgi:hypothetical protein
MTQNNDSSRILPRAAGQTPHKHNPGFVTHMGPTISQALEMLKQQ